MKLYKLDTLSTKLALSTGYKMFTWQDPDPTLWLEQLEDSIATRKETWVLEASPPTALLTVVLLFLIYLGHNDLLPYFLIYKNLVFTLKHKEKPTSLVPA